MKAKAILRILCVSSFVLLLLLLAQTSARADTFTVTVDTSSLIGNPTGPFEVGFALVNPSGTPDSGNTATVSDFTFTGGGSEGAVNSAFTVGGASGDFASGFDLVDSSDVNGIAAYFTPGDTFSFQVTLTTSTPDDEFVVLLFNGAGAEVPTTSADDFVSQAVPIPGDGVTVTNYSIITTPEPGTLAMLSSGLIGLLGLGLMRKRQFVA